MKKLIITGHVGKDADVIVNSSTNELFAKFSVAVSVGNKEFPKTDWIDVICNDRLVEVAKQYVKKGGKVLVEGFPQSHAFIKDGVAIPSMKLYANIIELLGRPVQDTAGDEVISEEETLSKKVIE